MEQLGFHMFGSAGKTMVEISVIGFLMGTCIAFYVVIGDLSPVIISKIFAVQNYSHDSVRRFLIILITLTCVIPLCFQKSIESLSFVCRASIGFYVCLTIKTVFESFERFESDSNWSSNIDLWKPAGIMQCIPIFSMAMSCQMQLFEVYETMGFPGSFDRIRTTVHQATSICCIVYCIVGFFGYLAFYNQTIGGNILMNFRPSLANDAITIGFILSIACSFPLVIFPCRTSLASFLHRKGHHSELASYVPESKYQPLTLFIIFSTMILGILIPSVEVIISLVGSTIGVLVCILFPATCFVKIMQRNSVEKTFAQLIIVAGFIIMILGTYSNLIAIDIAKSGSHLEEKLSIVDNIIEHPKDTHNVQEQVKDAQTVVIQSIDNAAIKKNEPEVKISDDGIKKEEQVIADERTIISKDPQMEIQEKNEEIQELKDSKDKLEKEVLEMKEELVKQNKETQQLVLQKFEEIAEKVEKIEKQQDTGASAKEKPLDEHAQAEEIAHAPLEIKMNDAALKTSNNLTIKESDDVHKLKNLSKEEISKDEGVKSFEKEKSKPEPKTNDEAPKNEASELENSIDSKHSALAELKSEVAVESKPVAPGKNSGPLIIETRVDPIVKLIRSQEPLSYQVGEKMMETKKVNGSVLEPLMVPVDPKPNSAENEAKNEMRRKRETFDEALSSFDKTLQNFELKSMIGRDLKSASDQDD